MYSGVRILCCGAGGSLFRGSSDDSSASFSVFVFGFPRCNKRLVTESQRAPRRWIDHPNTLCRAYPCIIVSAISLIPLIIIIFPINPALAVPKFVNNVQNFPQADSAILFNVFSSKRFIKDTLSFIFEWPNMSRASEFSTFGFSAGNII